jgi:hypothetical protein
MDLSEDSLRDEYDDDMVTTIVMLKNSEEGQMDAETCC